MLCKRRGKAFGNTDLAETVNAIDHLPTNTLGKWPVLRMALQVRPESRARQAGYQMRQKYGTNYLLNQSDLA